ncbi:MAG TPA: 16S rRNA (uracil(1498)-N(3))-methyltransferase [Stellaceae bacterium]|nr:16S rRNA (uracil(1498)-N(3))-methyltransferase [Stellaceae bacterium]
MAQRRPPRVYVAEALAEGGAAELGAAQAHHLGTVLRLGRGDGVAAFNPRDGEFLCRIADLGRGRMRLAVLQRLRAPQDEADLWLLFAPIKRARLDWLIEKGTELGVAAFVPVWTERTEPQRFNRERLGAHMIGAAEQCGRLSLPELRAPETLARMLAAWPQERALALCDESGGGRPIAEVAAGCAGRKLAVLVGPEGGFAETELDALAKLSFVTRIGLGPRVLRAETAALAAVAVFQAIAGDGRSR